MRDAVGTEISRSISYPVGSSDIRRWAIATYWPESPPPMYLGARPLTAPEEFNPFAWAVSSHHVTHEPPVRLDEPDGLEVSVGVTGPGLKLMLNGGMSVRYGVEIKAGDVITRVKTLGGYTERDGQGGPLLLTIVLESWANQRSELVRHSSMTLIRC